MRTLGLETISGTGAPSPESRREAVSQTLDRLGNALSQVAGVPALFDCLRGAVWDRGKRKVSIIERSGLLPNTRFHRARLTDSTAEREKYFRGFLKRAKGRELAFFDPDKGLEVKSVKYGWKDSSQYVYLHEVSESFQAGHSLLIFQHRQRNKPEEFSEHLAGCLLEAAIGARQAYVFRTAFAAFALVPHPSHSKRFAKQVARIEREDWGGIIETLTYSKEVER